MAREFLTIAILAVSALATYTGDFKLNTYWGQSGDGDTLGKYCALEGIDYITLAFVNNSPEHGDGTDYPGTNFASHCAADVYMKGNLHSKLLSGCSFIADDIKLCQESGKKILLSIGGEYTAANDYSISSVEKGKEFADFMFDAFGPYVDGYQGPRPFDRSDIEHTCINGFDFDIEHMFEDQAPYIAMVNRLRERTKDCNEEIIISAAPQCPLSDEYCQMKSILQHVKFDKIWVQFYNNPSCDATGSGFNYNDWVHFIEGTPSRDSELYIGLPASLMATAGGSGYIAPEAVKTLICDYKRQAKFAGVMLWDANYAVKNMNYGKSYYESVSEALRCGGCPDDICAPSQPVSSSIVSLSTTVPSVTPSMMSPGTASTTIDAHDSLSLTPATSSEGDNTSNATDQTSSSDLVTYTTSSYTPDTKTIPLHTATHAITGITAVSERTYSVTGISPKIAPISTTRSEATTYTTNHQEDTITPSIELLTGGPAISSTCLTYDPASTSSNSTSSLVCSPSTDCTDVTSVSTASVLPVVRSSSGATPRMSSQEVFEKIALVEGKRLAVLWLGGMTMAFLLLLRLNYVLENLGRGG
ncbi:glycoside hydrolase superfamily [Camillea tinctor]|nr:glycoside hydrolase superfamily [Camillea tinctor]